ncbi:MAG: hypothetical protein H7Z75_16550 [Ferruginibacter sp.]|nr:hypothetical protein [Cytophagales bacterium]
MSLTIRAQSFSGVYSIGKTTFKVKALSEEDQERGIFNIVYSKGDKVGTMASLTEQAGFEYVFNEGLGDRSMGDFYFTKAWKGKPLEGYYIREKDQKRFAVKFLRE